MGATQTRTCDCTDETADSYEHMYVATNCVYNPETKKWSEGFLSELDAKSGLKPYCTGCLKNGIAHYVDRPDGGKYYCIGCKNNIIENDKWNYCYGDRDNKIYHRPKAICKVKKSSS